MSRPVAIVSGAARNVGKGIAAKLLQGNYRVYLLDINQELLDSCIESFNYDQAIGCPVDITNKAALKKCIEDIYQENQRIDVLVNNAVVRPTGTYKQDFLDLSDDYLSVFIQQNIDAFVCLSKYCASYMTKNKSGSIINISSNGAIQAHRRMIPYDTVKGAMEAFTRALALELAPYNVRVNTVRTVAVAEEGKLDQDYEAGLGAQIPVGRIARPHDVAAMVAHLCSDESSFLTGQIYNVDGGMLVQSRPPALDLPAG